MIGARNRVAEVLTRKRGLSIEMIRRLHEKLGISAEVLIRPTGNKEAT
jgi:HTH-type transcriptional regulator/antitoxin HigA